MSTFSQKTLDKFKIVCYYGLVIKNDVRRIITASLLSTELSHSTSSRTGNNPRYCGLLPICMRSRSPCHVGNMAWPLLGGDGLDHFWTSIPSMGDSRSPAFCGVVVARERSPPARRRSAPREAGVKGDRQMWALSPAWRQIFPPILGGLPHPRLIVESAGFLFQIFRPTDRGL